MKKILCCICPKITLEQTDSFMFICPKCKRSYNLYYEIMNFPDEIESSHDEEGNIIELSGLSVGGPGLLSANDNEFPTLDQQYEQLHNKAKIPIPKYMKNGPVTTVEEFHEEII